MQRLHRTPCRHCKRKGGMVSPKKKQWDVHCYVRFGFAVENGYLKCGLRLCVLVLTIIYVNLFRCHLYGWFGQLLYFWLSLYGFISKVCGLQLLR